MEASLLGFVLVLQGALVWAAPGSCVFPKFSHNDKEALAWLEKRIKDRHPTSEHTSTSRNWSKYGKIKNRGSTLNSNTSWDEFEQFVNWLHNDDYTSSHKFFLQETKEFKLKNEAVSSARRDHGPIAVSALNLQEGDTLLEIPIHKCILDKVSKDDPLSLQGAPWELRLASRLLRERSKSAHSAWYPFIRLLPIMRLPLFFLESELDNCEDASISKEVLSLRSFAEAAFRALDQHEISSSSFADFVWALGVVYSFACRVDDPNQNLEPHMDSTHLLIPFLGSRSNSLSAKARVELHGPKFKMIMLENAAEGSPLYLDHSLRTSRDSFLYRGFFPTKLPHDTAKIFENLQDLVEWYLSTYGKKTEIQKLPVLMLVESALQRFRDQANNELFKGKFSSSSADFSVGVDGYIDPYMICALSNLFNLDGNQQRTLGNGVLDSFDDITEGDFRKRFAFSNNSVPLSKLAGSVCKSRTLHVIDVWNKQTLAYVGLALRKRISTILDSLSTLEEDETLLKASLWEGFSDGGSHLCETCQWQTEEISFNDLLALQLRIRKKHVLLNALSALSHDCNSKEDKHVNAKETVDNSDDAHAKAAEEFLKWCRKEGAQITEALAVTDILERSSLTGSNNVVRGTKALRDIEQGETICILPLKLGLFDKSSSHLAGADSWHLAAAHLLQEKSLGANSKWASYIAILPRTMQTPIYLMPSELKEVQWWPVLRELIQVRRAIKKSFSQLAGPKLAWADFEQYRWAVTMVHSRAFTLPVDDEEEYASYVLMPFMDMINHHFEYQADWMSLPVRDGKLQIVAKRHVPKGHQLFASFGPRSNDNLFLYYGFILENNPFDSAQVFSSFQDAVHWLIALWGSSCDEHFGTRVIQECRQKGEEKMWTKAQRAIDDYAAGVTEQRPEWWTLVNTWAEYGYEYMQFQPSPSIYAGGIMDPTLYVAMEAVVEALNHDRKAVLKSCRHSESNMIDRKSSLEDFFVCLEDTRWRSAYWALHSSVCSEYACRALASLDESIITKLMVKVSLSLRCLEILNSFPTTIVEDKLLLKEHNHSSIHVQLSRQYRHIKKLFFKDFIQHVIVGD
eukprot:c18698_g1_i1 orf=110-3349(+)